MFMLLLAAVHVQLRVTEDIKSFLEEQWKPSSIAGQVSNQLQIEKLCDVRYSFMF
jgi:hypothetical protein